VRRIFWGTGLAAAACLAVGWGIAFGDAIAHAYGGKSVVVAPVLTYLVSEVGATIIWGPGGILLGIALITLMAGVAHDATGLAAMVDARCWPGRIRVCCVLPVRAADLVGDRNRRLATDRSPGASSKRGL